MHTLPCGILALSFLTIAAPGPGGPPTTFAMAAGSAHGDWSQTLSVPVQATLPGRGGFQLVIGGQELIDEFLVITNDGETIEILDAAPNLGGVTIFEMTVNTSAAEALCGAPVATKLSAQGSVFTVKIDFPNGNPLPPLPAPTTLYQLEFRALERTAPAGRLILEMVPALCFADTTNITDVTHGEITLARHFLRGDANFDGSVDIADVAAILASEIPPEQDAADANDDGVLTIADVIFLLDALFTPGARQPPPPFPIVGRDPTADNLGQASGDRLYSLSGAF